MWGSLRRSLRVAQECRRCHAMSSAACGPSSRLSAFTFVGPSGFGKSSNLRCLNRLVEPSSASTDEMTRIWEGFYRSEVSRPGSRPSASGQVLRSIAVWSRGITRATAQILQKCNLCEISRQPFGVTSSTARRKNDS